MKIRKKLINYKIINDVSILESTAVCAAAAFTVNCSRCTPSCADTVRKFSLHS